MQKETRFLDKVTLIITIVCTVIISVTGIIFLNMENKDKSTIIKSDENILIEKAVAGKTDNAINENGYDAKTYGLININTAPKEDLMLLDNIGDKRADAIIEYRISTPFKTKHDITNIKGIGEKTYEKIKDKICVE